MIPKSIFAIGLMFVASMAWAQPKPTVFLKKTPYEVVDFEDLMHRYLGKETGSFNRLEGIYSVSCVITKSSKAFFTGQLKVKVVERKDNYARVAILKDWPGSQRDFIEVSLSYRASNVYPIMGELSAFASGGEAFIYKHIEPDGTYRDFSMAPALPDMIEGEFSEMHKRKTITYKLSYVKLYPKEHPQEIIAGSKK